MRHSTLVKIFGITARLHVVYPYFVLAVVHIKSSVEGWKRTIFRVTASFLLKIQEYPTCRPIPRSSPKSSARSTAASF